MKVFYRKMLGFTLATTIIGFTLIAPAVAEASVHQVKKGETLWTIARHYQMSVDELARLNGIRNNDFIKPGMELNVGDRFKLYQVKKGETLWSISQKFDISYLDLIDFNGLTNPDKIRPGMSIKIPHSSDKNGTTAASQIPETYTVKNGESLWSIAKKFNLSYQDIIAYNNLKDPDSIKVGMKLNLVQKIQSYIVKSGENLWSIAGKFGISYQDLIKLNNIKNPDTIRAGMKLKIATSPSITSGQSGSSTKIQQSMFIWPARGTISSPYGSRWGKMHWGIDIALPIGRNIIAAASGKVVWGGWVNGYGNTVIIDHGNGYRTLYGHNSKLLVTGGDYVKQGQLIARSGNSGRSTGPHLHFEVQKDGKAQNPMNYLK